MLKINKNITLSGNVEIEGKAVVYLSATIGTNNPTANVTRTINDLEVYNSNKVAIRKDIASFEEAVYKLEDEMANKEVQA